MQIEHLKKNFYRKAESEGFLYELNSPASDEQITGFESRYELRLPEPVIVFYKNYNGLYVTEPHLSVIPIERFELMKNHLIHFATFDRQHKICFDTSYINQANQWDIINCKTGYVVTRSMASFWTNKIWNWVVKRRTIWKKERFSSFEQM